MSVTLYPFDFFIISCFYYIIYMQFNRILAVIKLYFLLSNIEPAEMQQNTGQWIYSRHLVVV